MHTQYTLTHVRESTPSTDISPSLHVVIPAVLGPAAPDGTAAPRPAAGGGHGAGVRDHRRSTERRGPTARLPPGTSPTPSRCCRTTTSLSMARVCWRGRSSTSAGSASRNWPPKRKERRHVLPRSDGGHSPFCSRISSSKRRMVWETVRRSRLARRRSTCRMGSGGRRETTGFLCRSPGSSAFLLESVVFFLLMRSMVHPLFRWQRVAST